MIQVKDSPNGAFETVDATDYYCPSCGQKPVYVTQGDGDYYTGPTHYCRSCSYQFSLPYGSSDQQLEWQTA